MPPVTRRRSWAATTDIFCQWPGRLSGVRASRLLSLLLLLQNRGRMSAAQLAAQLGVTARTIYRDVEALAAAGVPIYAEQGPTGGYQLMDGYRTRLTGLTADEAESLFLTGMQQPAACANAANSRKEKARSTETRASLRVIASRKIVAVRKATPIFANQRRQRSATNTFSRESARHRRNKATACSPLK